MRRRRGPVTPEGPAPNTGMPDPERRPPPQMPPPKAPETPKEPPAEPEASRIHETIIVPMQAVRLNAWNPNAENEATFNALVENIRKYGQVIPLQVRRIAPASRTAEEVEQGIEFEVIGGEHRLRAMRVLEYEVVAITVQDGLTDADARLQTVSLNIIAGKMDPVKFTKLVDDLGRYGMTKDVAKEMMRFTNDSAFDALYRETRAGLPPELREELDKSRGEMQNVDDLSRILNKMFATYGDTLKWSFMLFEFGGQVHWWVKMDKPLKDAMQTLGAIARDREVDINVLLSAALKAGMPQATEVAA